MRQGIVALIVADPKLKFEVLRTELVAEHVEGNFCPATVDAQLIRRIDDGGFIGVGALQNDAGALVFVGQDRVVVVNDRFDPNGDFIKGSAVDLDIRLGGIVTCGRRVLAGALVFDDSHDVLIFAACDGKPGVGAVGVVVGRPSRPNGFFGGDQTSGAVAGGHGFSRNGFTVGPGPACGGLQIGRRGNEVVVTEFTFGVEEGNDLDGVALGGGVVIACLDLGGDYVVKECVAFHLVIVVTQGKSDGDGRRIRRRRLHVEGVGRKLARRVDLLELGIAVVRGDADRRAVFRGDVDNLYFDGNGVISGRGGGEGVGVTENVLFLIVDHKDLVVGDCAVRIGKIAPLGTVFVVIRAGIHDACDLVVSGISAGSIRRPTGRSIGQGGVA